MSRFNTLTVEIEFLPGTFTDVTGYVNLAGRSLDFQHGRTNQYEQPSTGQLSLMLDNTDGRFTPEAAVLNNGTTANPLYPYVQENKRVRVWAQHGNLMSSANTTFESGITGWVAGGTVPPTIAQSSTQAWQGTYSQQVTWGTAGSFPNTSTTFPALIVGQTYTASAYVFVPAGTSPFVQLAMGGIGTGTGNSTRGVWQRITYTFVADALDLEFQVWPTSAPTAGHLVYIDGVQLDAGATAQTYRSDGGIYPLWSGYVDSWTASFPGGEGKWNRVYVTASDRFKILSRRRLRSVHEEVAREAGAGAYYPFSVSDSDSIPGELTDAIRVDGTGLVVPPAFNTAAEQAYSNDEKPQQLEGALQFTESVNQNPGYGAGVARIPPLFDTGSDFTFTVACWFKMEPTAFALGATLFQIGTELRVWVATSTGYLAMAHGSALTTVSSSVDDGKWHHYLGVFNRSGVSTDATSYVDGVLLSTDAGTGTAEPTQWWFVNGGDTVGSVSTKPEKAGASDDVSYSGLVLAQGDLSAFVTDLYEAGHNNITGESVADRAERILTWCGLAAADYDIATDTAAVIGAQDTAGKSALEALQELAAAEGAPMFINGAGQVVFQSRSQRATFTPAATFNSDTDIVGDAISITLADEGIVNQVTGTVSGGASAVAYINDSLGEYLTDSMSSSPLSPVEDSVEAPWSTVEQARDAAYRRLAEKFQAKLRFPQIVIDPFTATADIWPTALATEVSDLIRITGLVPATTGGLSQRELFIESVAWSLSIGAITLTVDTTALDYSLGWVRFDDTSTGRFGHDPGAMTVGTVGCLSGTGTGTFTCAVGTGPLWTTTVGDFPLKVKIGEEALTISAISGASTPQTFTVSARGANGSVAVAHASGSLIQLWPIPVYAQ